MSLWPPVQKPHVGAIALAVLGLCTAAVAQTVDLTGTAGGKALLVIDGAAPRFMAPGQSYAGVRVLSVEGDRVTLDVQGERRSLRMGEGPVSAVPARTDRPDIVMLADPAGHFSTNGQINGKPVRFLVDTGATVIALSEAEAQRLGLLYKQGAPVRVKTANGELVGHQLQLGTVRIGEHVSHGVDAVVLPASVPYILLGNSFLSRFDMRRESDRMVLAPRY